MSQKVAISSRWQPSLCQFRASPKVNKHSLQQQQQPVDIAGYITRSHHQVLPIAFYFSCCSIAISYLLLSASHCFIFAPCASGAYDNAVMGIPGYVLNLEIGIHLLMQTRIYNEIGPGERVSLAKLAIEKFEQTERPLRIAIDISIWNFEIQGSKGESEQDNT